MTLKAELEAQQGAEFVAERQRALELASMVKEMEQNYQTALDAVSLEVAAHQKTRDQLTAAERERDAALASARHWEKMADITRNSGDKAWEAERAAHQKTKEEAEQAKREKGHI